MITVFSGCNSSHNIPKGYSIVCARSFSVIEFTADNPDGRIKYQLNKQGDTIITAVSYNSESKILAIAITKKEPEKGSAKIVFQKKESSSPFAEIALNKYYYVQDMALSANGKIAFSAKSLNRELPEELCYVDSYEKSDLFFLAKANRITNLSWNTDTTEVYFACQKGANRIVAYVNLENPGVVKTIDEGISIALSESGKLAYLKLDGHILFLEKLGQTPVILNLPSKYTNPQYTDSIRFVGGTEEIILQHYKKSIVYDLIVTKPPYRDVEVLMKNIGMQDYYVIRQG